ncbi:hypothetical protein ACH9L7_03745 [Haloferax sp. S1W]|uniref:hypothetical protein n=1 Tax=Haloferax sp. S1W TaxID=3377110 RepID=UPI0037CB474D
MGEAEDRPASLDVEIGGLGGEVTLADLFPPSWVDEHCDVASIDEFVAESGFDVTDQESFESIPDHEWNRHVETHSTFDDWEAMLSAGVEHYVSARNGDTDAAADTETDSAESAADANDKADGSAVDANDKADGEGDSTEEEQSPPMSV